MQITCAVFGLCCDDAPLVCQPALPNAHDHPLSTYTGGVPCLRLEVRGTSFMLHQIRHMIGAAVAVARGLLTVELIHASITTPCRMSVSE